MDDRLKLLKGFISQKEGEQLFEMASNVPMGLDIVEIGSYMGQSTCYLGAGSKAGCRNLVTAVDLWEEGSDIRYCIPMVRHTFDEQVEWMGLQNLIRPICGHSAHVAQSWDSPIGLLFIDGCHDYEAVKMDFEAWSIHVVVNGLIVFHDYKNPLYPLIVGVEQFADELVNSSDQYQFKSLTDSLYAVRKARR